MTSSEHTGREAEIRARLDSARRHAEMAKAAATRPDTFWHTLAEDTKYLLGLVGVLEGQLAKAREVHYPVNIFAESDEPPYMCGWRAVCNHSENAWPCDTAKALGLGEGDSDER